MATDQLPDVARAMLRIGRRRLVIVMVSLFGLGLFFMWGMFAKEFPRLDPWQRVFIWIGDFSAVVYTLRWGFMPEVSSSSPGRRRALILLFLALAMDLIVTGGGILVERNAFHRRIETLADVVGMKTIRWQSEVATYFELTVQFRDVDGGQQKGLVNFIRQHEKGFPDWVPGEIRQKLLQGGRPETMAIRYDPLRPQRVWGLEEPWNRSNAIFHVFLLIHFFQMLVCVLLVTPSFSAGDDKLLSETAAIAPFAAEVFALVFFGFLFWIRGF